MRYDRKYGIEETMHYQLWCSDKVSVEDREWLDSISTKRNLKFSEQDRIEQLYFKIFGEQKSYPDVS